MVNHEMSIVANQSCDTSFYTKIVISVAIHILQKLDSIGIGSNRTNIFIVLSLMLQFPRLSHNIFLNSYENGEKIGFASFNIIVYSARLPPELFQHSSHLKYIVTKTNSEFVSLKNTRVFFPRSNEQQKISFYIRSKHYVHLSAIIQRT